MRFQIWPLSVWTNLSVGCVLATALATGGQINAAAAFPVGGTSRDCSVPTTVTEMNFFGSTKHFILNITDSNGDVIDQFNLGNIASGGSVTQNVPPEGDNDCDAYNVSTQPVAGGAGGGVQTTGLRIESYYYDAVLHRWVIESNADFLRNAGRGSVDLPDLWADNGTDLYGLVNLETFLLAPVPVVPGLDYTIVGSHVAGLPGYEFSTVPWIFNPLAGPATDPWNGTPPPDGTTAAVITDHTPAVPEPDTSSLMIGGFLVMFSVLWYRRRPQNMPACNSAQGPFHR